MRKALLATAILLFLLPCSAPAHAGEGVPELCEVTVGLKKNGRASVEYAVKYRHVSGSFHGFYFTGPQIDRLNSVWDDAWGRATEDRGGTYGIVRGRRSGEKTIELADGEGIDRGSVIFKFRFATDLCRAGFLAHTTDAEGRRLVVLNWAPSTWDHRLLHYTVRIRYPVDAPPPPVTRPSSRASTSAPSAS